MKPSIPLYHIQPRPNVYKLPPVEPWEVLQREDEAESERAEAVIMVICAALAVVVSLSVIAMLWLVVVTP